MVFRSGIVFAGVLACIAVSLPFKASAHGLGGLTLTSTTTDGYIVDIDNSDAQMEAGSLTGFSFNLFEDAARENPVDFTGVWVRINKDVGNEGGQMVFVGTVGKPLLGVTQFSFIFPESGRYILSVRYVDVNKGRFGETVAEAQFPLEVFRSRDEESFKFTSYEFLVGIGTGLFLTIISLLPFLIKRKS